MNLVQVKEFDPLEEVRGLKKISGITSIVLMWLNYEVNTHIPSV
jgi:hypothetical protein